MSWKRLLFSLAAPLAVTACGSDDTVSPQDKALDMSRRFEQVADSLELAGDPNAAEGARGLAELLKMTQTLSTVSVSVDGSARSYNALGMQLRVPEAPGDICEGDPECIEFEDAPTFTQIVFAWRGESVDEAIAFIADSVGSWAIELPDDVENPRELPHVIGAMVEVASERAWVTTGGTAGSTAVSTGGQCATSTKIPPTVGYSCNVVSIRFAANVQLNQIDTERGGIIAGSTRTLVMQSQPVSGAYLNITALPEGVRLQSARRWLPIHFPGH